MIHIWKRNSKQLILSCLIFILAIATYYFYYIKYHKNFTIVLPNQIYRSAQPNETDFAMWQKKYHLATILNLRGQKNNFNDVLEHSIQLSSARVPSAKVMNQLVDILDIAKPPILIHCKHGIDRSALTSAVALLLRGHSVDEALKQYSLWNGFLPFRRQGILKAPIYDYDKWLKEQGKESSRESFKFWVKNYYSQYYYNALIEVKSLEQKIKAGTQQKLQALVTNASKHAFTLSDSADGGVYLYRCYSDLKTKSEYCDNFSGTNSEVTKLKLEPNKSVVIDFTLPPLKVKGKYEMKLYLAQNGRYIFQEYGNEVVAKSFEVG